MFEIHMTLFSWIAWIIAIVVAIVVTIYVSMAGNLFEKGSDGHVALRISRISLVVLMWSPAVGLIRNFDLALVGVALAFISFILAIIGIVKGKVIYGIMLIIGAVCVPILLFINMLSEFRDLL